MSKFVVNGFLSLFCKKSASRSNYTGMDCKILLCGDLVCDWHQAFSPSFLSESMLYGFFFFFAQKWAKS